MTRRPVPDDVIEYLRDLHDLANDGTCVVRRTTEYSEFASGAVECYGIMPNSSKTGWFFAGYVDDIRIEAAREKHWAIEDNAPPRDGTQCGSSHLG